MPTDGLVCFTDQECISINGTMVRPPLSSQDAVCLWEIPGDCTLEGLEFWQSGRYGPICRASLRREATPTPVVVKTLRGALQDSIFTHIQLLSSRLFSGLDTHRRDTNEDIFFKIYNSNHAL